MQHAVIWATDDGCKLSPLSSKERPLPFLALGEARSFLRRAVDRLAPLIPLRNLWVVVRIGHRQHARAQLPEGVRILVEPDGPSEQAFPLPSFVAQAIRAVDPQALVLSQPSTCVAKDEEAYCKRVGEGFELACARKQGVMFTSQSAEGKARNDDGIFIWPLAALGAGRASPMAPGCDEFIRLPLGEHVGVCNVCDWNALLRLLSYIPKPWGHESVWALNQHYAGKILVIKAGQSLSLQYHEVKTETIRIAAGRMRFKFGASPENLTSVDLTAGMSFFIPAGLIHQMEALEDCEVIEVSTPHLADLVRLQDRYGRT